jgi:hypothetical protein
MVSDWFRIAEKMFWDWTLIVRDGVTASSPMRGPSSRRLRGRSNQGQIPGLMLDPREHSGKNHKGGDNCCNDHCVYGRHDIPPFCVILPSREEPSFDLDQ